MRKIVAFEQVSLDGFFVDAKGDMSWAHKQDAEWNAFTAGNASGNGALLFGRKTYDMMASFWPSPMAMQAGMGWQPAMAIWAIPALLAVPLAWYALSLMGATAPAPNASASQAPSDTGWLLHKKRTWLLLLAFGLMNGGYASTVAWLAPFYQTHGWTATQSGTLLAILSIAQAVSALVMPALARRNVDRRLWVAVALLLQIIGFGGLALSPDAMPTLNAIVLGLGLGGCFSLFMLVALDHLPSPSQAGALNALMQGGGFILAALAPLIMAQLHQISGNWAAGC